MPGSKSQSKSDDGAKAEEGTKKSEEDAKAGGVEEGTKQSEEGVKEESGIDQVADVTSKLVTWRKMFEDNGWAQGQVYNDWATLMIMGLNVFALAMSLMVFGKTMLTIIKFQRECIWLVIKNPVIIGFLFSTLLFVISIAGFFGMWFNRMWIVKFQVFLSVLLLHMLFIYTVYGLIVTAGGTATKPPEGIRFKSYVLDSYSDYLQNKVNNSVTWFEITDCILSSGFCSKPFWDMSSPQQLYDSDLSSIQVGCCMPPFSCGFVYIGRNAWKDPTGYPEPDCRKWKADENDVCFDCSYCKAGFLQTVKDTWFGASIINVVASGMLVVIISRTCFVLRKSERWKNLALPVREPKDEESPEGEGEGEESESLDKKQKAHAVSPPWDRNPVGGMQSSDAAFLQGGDDSNFMDPYGQGYDPNDPYGMYTDPQDQGYDPNDPYGMYTDTQDQMYAEESQWYDPNQDQAYYSDPNQYSDQSQADYYSDPYQTEYMDPSQAAEPNYDQAWQ